MNEHAKLKLVKARTNLLLSHFFWGRLALYLQMVEDPKVETLEVDGKHIFYNPDFVLSLSADLIQSAVVHEISHCMFEHISRRVGRNPNVWNYACDYAANLIRSTYKATGQKKSSIKVTAGALPSELHKMIVWIMHHQESAVHLLPKYKDLRELDAEHAAAEIGKAMK